MKYLFISRWKRTQGKGGLAQYAFNDITGELSLQNSFFEDAKLNVSFMDEEKGILYVLKEVENADGYRFGGGGSAYVFYFDKKTGECIKTEITPLSCVNPCNFAVTKNGKNILVSAHGTKSYVTHLVKGEDGEFGAKVLVDDTPVVLFARNEDGSIGKIIDADWHHGSGPSPKQTTARPHSVSQSPCGRFTAVCDKGNDHIYMYKIDEASNKLVLCGEPIMTAAGWEPRYCVFHPTLPYLYVNSESTTELAVYKYSDDGILKLVEKVQAVSEPEIPGTYKVLEQQDLRISADGEYIYDVVRGPNVVAVFKVDKQTGLPKLIQECKVDDEWPRGLAIADDRFLFVLCVGTGKAVEFRIEEDGQLTDTGLVYDCDNAAYATFWDTEK